MADRRLIIMRHATAGAGGSGPDHARRLTEVGLDEARSVGRRLGELGIGLDRVLCSSATRCRETWDAVSEALSAPSRIDFEDALYNAGTRALHDALIGGGDEQALLLLAHNPGVSMLAIELSRDDDASESRLRGGFAPASIALFEIEGAWASLSPETARLSHFERPHRS